MSELGMCSRREADELIRRGWVKVNGEVISELGSKVSPEAQVELLPQAKDFLGKKLTVILHKPVGYVSGPAEKEYPSALELIRPENQESADSSPGKIHRDGLAPAGRLDIDSRGLLVLTQDGKVAKQLVGEGSPVEKEYLVGVDGSTANQVLEKLRHGLELDGKKLRPAKIELIKPGLLQFILVEGRKRQIRRMCELVGLKVTSLKRVRIGKLRLGALKVGQWRLMTDKESF